MSDYTYDAVVVKVHDGDTVVLDVDLGFGVWHRGMTIRLYGINAPELNTPAGRDALAYLSGIIPPGKRVVLLSEKDKADKYGGRWLGTLFAGDPASVNLQMITSGHAKKWDGKGEKPLTTDEVRAALVKLVDEIQASDTWVRHTSAYEEAREVLGVGPDDHRHHARPEE